MNHYAYNCSPFELELVRNKLKANVLFGLDNTAQISEDIGRQLLTHGRRIHPTEMIARIDDVDVNCLRSTVHKYFIDRDHVSAALGAVYELPDYNNIRLRSYMKRY